MCTKKLKNIVSYVFSLSYSNYLGKYRGCAVCLTSSTRAMMASAIGEEGWGASVGQGAAAVQCDWPKVQGRWWRQPWVRRLRCRHGGRCSSCSVWLTSSTRAMMAAAMGEEAEVPVWEEVQRLCSMTDLKYKGDDGVSNWWGGLRCQCGARCSSCAVWLT